MATPRREAPGLYADEDIDRPLIEALRARGFDVLSVQATRAFGVGDPAHLERAAALGRVVLTYNRRHFRRHHRAWMEANRAHAGIVSIPQGGSFARRAVRVGMLLDWFGPAGLASNCVSWIDLQTRLHGGERVPGYTDQEVRLALGLTQT